MDTPPDSKYNKGEAYIPAALDDYGLTPDEFRVFCRIRRRGDCTEGTRGIADGCRLSDRQVRYAVHVLLACGFISQELRTGFTSILRCNPPSEWVSPEQYYTTRESVRKGDPEKKPARRPVDSAQDAGLHVMQGVLHTVQGVLHTVQGGTAHGAAKGTPIKVLQEGTKTTISGEIVVGADAPATEPPAKIRQASEEKKVSKADPRTKHPAIQAYKEASGKFPKRELYDRIIASLGDEPDAVRLGECRLEWLTRGYNPSAATWALDWYGQGIPQRGGRASPANRSDALVANNLSETDKWLARYEVTNDQPRPN